MKVIDIYTEEITIPLKKPFKTSVRTAHDLNSILVKVQTDEGEVGFGEAAPNPLVTGETKESIISAIQNFIKPKIINSDVNNLEEIMNKLHNSILNNNSAKAAVDIAIYDLYSKSLKIPLYKSIGGYSSNIETDITISVNHIDEMVSDSIEAVENGYGTLKIKLGLNFNEDIDRVMEIRKAVGNNVNLRIDSNQGWSPKEAVKVIREFEKKDLRIELIEQPVNYQNINGMAYVKDNVHTPIMADESVFSPRDAIEVIQRNAADLINIKLMKTGGIYRALQLCSIAESLGIQCMVGCMMESKIGISAASHLGAAKRNITKVDLDAHNLCATDPFVGGPIFNKNNIHMTNEHGIGFNDINNALFLHGEQ
ncbi:dipeptide epimerase [Virgibacillus sp. DJP39]|uniref:dipeptide epimerase n=1 Tax=Virgibacillus sp. DJP39 TaxID=3409790 RepID=UPI003BB76CDC